MKLLCEWINVLISENRYRFGKNMLFRIWNVKFKNGMLFLFNGFDKRSEIFGESYKIKFIVKLKYLK